MEVRTAREAAEALIAALGLRYGEITIRVRDQELTLGVREETLTLDELDAIAVPAVGG